MSVEIIDKINELKKLGVSTSGLPDQWRREVCDLIATGTTVAEISKQTGINILTVESWIRKYKARKSASLFKEAKVVQTEERAAAPAAPIAAKLSPDVLYKIEIKNGAWVTSLQSTDKRELIRYLELT